jgi:hypothetical protein
MDTTMNFWADVAHDHNNPEYRVELPVDVDKVDCNIDPNNLSRIEIQRSPEWCEETWSKMIKPKYTNAIKRWTGETGGGDGHPWNFQDYCGNEKWLAIVYMIDDANDGILSSGIGIVPTTLKNESSDRAPLVAVASATPRLRALEENAKDIKALTGNISS